MKCIIKCCGICNATFEDPPKNHIKDDVGYWWNCVCGETLFIPYEMARVQWDTRLLEFIKQNFRCKNS